MSTEYPWVRSSFCVIHEDSVPNIIETFQVFYSVYYFSSTRNPMSSTPKFRVETVKGHHSRTSFNVFRRLGVGDTLPGILSCYDLRIVNSRNPIHRS